MTTHGRFEFPMPASADVVFVAFHYHAWRNRWDSLVADTRVADGAPCPYVGAISRNTGAGWLRGITMATRFVSFERPRVAAATLVEPSFPFVRWAASMRHRALPDGQSTMVYTYTFDVSGPRLVRVLLEPVVARLFATQTRRRFARLQQFLAASAAEVEQWQRDGGDREAAR